MSKIKYSTLNSHADIISDAGLSVKPEWSNQSESISVSSKPISTFISIDDEESQYQTVSGQHNEIRSEKCGACIEQL